MPWLTDPVLPLSEQDRRLQCIDPTAPSFDCTVAPTCHGLVQNPQLCLATLMWWTSPHRILRPDCGFEHGTIHNWLVRKGSMPYWWATHALSSRLCSKYQKMYIYAHICVQRIKRRSCMRHMSPYPSWQESLFVILWSKPEYWNAVNT